MTRLIADEMRERLATLGPTRLEVIDESHLHAGHAGARPEGQTHYRIRLSAPVLADLGRVERHRLVNRTLGDIVPRIHALTMELSAD